MLDCQQYSCHCCSLSPVMSFLVWCQCLLSSVILSCCFLSVCTCFCFVTSIVALLWSIPLLSFVAVIFPCCLLALFVGALLYQLVLIIILCCGPFWSVSDFCPSGLLVLFVVNIFLFCSSVSVVLCHSPSFPCILVISFFTPLSMCLCHQCCPFKSGGNALCPCCPFTLLFLLCAL